MVYDPKTSRRIQDRIADVIKHIQSHIRLIDKETEFAKKFGVALNPDDIKRLNEELCVEMDALRQFPLDASYDEYLDFRNPEPTENAIPHSNTFGETVNMLNAISQNSEFLKWLRR